MKSAAKKADVSLRSLKRNIHSRIDKAITDTEQTVSAEDKKIHTIRLRCKQIRATLRLLRTISPRRSRRAATHIRDAAAALSPMRDAQILPSAMKRVLATAGRQEVMPVSEGLADAINRHCEDLIATVELSSALTIVADRLSRARKLVSDISGCDRKPLTAESLLPMYRRGRKSVKRADEVGEAESFHQLRKDVKAHLQHCRFLRPRYKKGLTDRIKKTRRLGTLLGDAQDLVVLHEFLARACRDDCLASECSRYCTSSEELIVELHSQALKLADKLYSKSPMKFAAALEAST